MDIEQLRNWIAQLTPLGEDTMPYLEIDGKMYTPRQLLAEAEAGTEIWTKANKMLGGNPEPIKVSWELLKKRFEERVKQGKVAPIAYIEGVSLSPEQQLDEVQKGTSLGYNLLFGEMKLMEEIEKRRK